MQTVVIYPGRFHPFHRGHLASYQNLVQKYGADSVFIATSDKQAPITSPFTFGDKQLMMSKLGVPASRVIKTRNPYQATEITQSFDPDTTVLIFALSEKDADRFNFAPKKDGSPSYMQPFPTKGRMKPFKDHAYILITPTVDFKLPGTNVRSATEIRNLYANGSNEQRDAIIAALYGDADKNLRGIFDQRLDPGEQIKEFVNEQRRRPTKRGINILERILRLERIVREEIDFTREFIIYIDDKPISKYSTPEEAKVAADRLHAKFKNRSIEIRQEICDTKLIRKIAENLHHYLTKKNLTEARMSPTVFRNAVKEGGDLGVLVGFEFEVCVPKERVVAWENRGREVAEQEPVVNWGTTTVKGWLQKLERVTDPKTVFDQMLESAEPVPGVEPSTKKIVDAFYKSTLHATYSSILNIAISRAYDRLVSRNYEGDMTDWVKTKEQRAAEVKELLKSKNIDIDDPASFVNFMTRTSTQDAINNFINPIRDQLSFYSEAYYDARRENNHNDQHPEVAELRANKIFWDGLLDYTRDQMYSAYRFNDAEGRDRFARWVKSKYNTVNMAPLTAGPWKILPGQAKRINNVLGGYNPDFNPNESRRYGSMYRRTAEFVENLIKPVFNRPVHIFNSYHGGTKNLTDWYIEPDGSLRPNGDDGACEIVGPPLPAPDAIRALKNFYQVAQENGFYTGADNKTGLHINVSIPRSLDVFKLATFVGDEHVLKQFGRENNSYANSVIKSLRQNGSGRDLASTPDAMKKLKEIVRDISRAHMSSVSTENSKYVSFRHAGGDYLKRPEDVENVVGRFVRAMVIASDPDAYRDEYLNKASRFIQPKKSAKIDDPRKLIQQIRESGVKVYTQDVYLLGDEERSDEELRQAVRRQYDSQDIDITNIQRNSQEAKDRMIAARTWRVSTRSEIEAADPSRFVSYTIFPSSLRGLQIMNQTHNLNDSFGVYLSTGKIGVGIRSSEEKIQRDNPIFQSLIREIVKKAQDRLISTRQVAQQQRADQQAAAQQRAAELQPEPPSGVGPREADLIDNTGSVTSLMITADFAEDAANIVVGMLNNSPLNVQQQWRQRLPLRLRFGGSEISVPWPAQVSTGGRPPERARYTVRDGRNGDILMTAAGPRTWEAVQQIARENAAARNVPQDAVRITDLDNHGVYFIDGTPVTAATMGQRGQQGPWVIIDTNQPADASGAVVAVITDPMTPTAAANLLYERSVDIYPGRPELAGRLRIINASTGQVLRRINQEDDYIAQEYIDRARRAGRGQQSAPQSTTLQGAANGEWIVYRREDGQDRMVYRTNGTRTFDYARDRVLRDADTRSIPHNEFVFYNESSGLRYDVDGELLPTRQTLGLWRVYTRMVPSGVRELWRYDSPDGCDFGYAQERFANAEQNVRDRLVFYNADTNRAYDYNGQPVTDITIPDSSPDTEQSRGGPFRAPHSSIFQIVNNRDGEILLPGRNMTWTEAEQWANRLISVRGVPRENIRIFDLNTNRAYFITGAPADAGTTASTPAGSSDTQGQSAQSSETREFTFYGFNSGDEILTITASNFDEEVVPRAQRWADRLGEPVEVRDSTDFVVYTADPSGQEPEPGQSRRTYEILDRNDADTTLETVTGTLEDAAAVAMDYERQGYRTIIFDEEGVAHYDPRDLSQLDESLDYLPEDWSQKYKRSINCAHPRGFSQRAHCAGRKKNKESVELEESSGYSLEGSVTPDLVYSKLWLLNKLSDIQPNISTLYALGSWYGNLAMLAAKLGKPSIEKIINVEKNPEFLDTSKKILDQLGIDNVEYMLKDANNLTYQQVDKNSVIVNTSLTDMPGRNWFNRIPDGTLVVLQARDQDPNNQFHSTDDILNKFPLSKIIYQGTAELEDPETVYNRFMVIGQK